MVVQFCILAASVMLRAIRPKPSSWPSSMAVLQGEWSSPASKNLCFAAPTLFCIDNCCWLLCHLCSSLASRHNHSLIGFPIKAKQLITHCHFPTSLCKACSAAGHPSTMSFGSTTKVPAKCMLTYCRILQCACSSLTSLSRARAHAFCHCWKESSGCCRRPL